jgi:hypothetical protein
MNIGFIAAIIAVFMIGLVFWFFKRSEKNETKLDDAVKEVDQAKKLEQYLEEDQVAAKKIIAEQTISKEDAIKLFYLFLQSDKVADEHSNFGMAPYDYFTLILKDRFAERYKVELSSAGMGRNDADFSYKRILSTPYGKVLLEPEESLKLREDFLNRNVVPVPMNELIEKL